MQCSDRNSDPGRSQNVLSLAVKQPDWRDFMGGIMRWLVLLLVPAVLSAGACSTIVEGEYQQILVQTTPPGAECKVIRQGVSIGHVYRTPGWIYVEKTKHDITINCTKYGYQTSTYTNRSGLAAATFGNIILGGLIGWGVDSATGSDNKYESPVHMKLVPY